MKLQNIVAAVAVSAAALTTSAFAEGRYVLMLKKNTSADSVAADIAAAGGTIVRALPQVGIAIATSDDENFAVSAKGISGVADAGQVGAWAVPADEMQPELEAPTAADAFYNQQRLWGIDRVKAPAAWANGNTGSHDTVVAVLDTGVQNNHPDLAPNLVHENCFTSTGNAGDGGCSPYPESSIHGSHVAGTVGAVFDGGAAVGVAPNIGIAGYKIFEDIPGCGYCAYSDSRWAAMIDAADRGFEVISMSLGGYVSTGGQGSNETTAYLQAEKKIAKYVSQQGTLMVASAGNGATDVNGPTWHVPGDIPEIVNVSAAGIRPIPVYPAENTFDVPAYYTNFGAAVDITGPGGDCGSPDACIAGTINGYSYLYYTILSTGPALDGVCHLTESCPASYWYSIGTSMATPHVSGVAALIFDANPGIKPHQVKARLKSSAENIGSRQEFGHGMVDAEAATD